jgi:hypothetical protein
LATSQLVLIRGQLVYRDFDLRFIFALAFGLVLDFAFAFALGFTLALSFGFAFGLAFGRTLTFGFGLGLVFGFGMDLRLAGAGNSDGASSIVGAGITAGCVVKGVPTSGQS